MHIGCSGRRALSSGNLKQGLWGAAPGDFEHISCIDYKRVNKICYISIVCSETPVIRA